MLHKLGRGSYSSSCCSVVFYLCLYLFFTYIFQAPYLGDRDLSAASRPTIPGIKVTINFFGVIWRIISCDMLVIAYNGYSELRASIVLEMADFFRFLVHVFGRSSSICNSECGNFFTTTFVQTIIILCFRCVIDITESFDGGRHTDSSSTAQMVSMVLLLRIGLLTMSCSDSCTGIGGSRKIYKQVLL